MNGFLLNLTFVVNSLSQLNLFELNGIVLNQICFFHLLDNFVKNWQYFSHRGLYFLLPLSLIKMIFS